MSEKPNRFPSANITPSIVGNMEDIIRPEKINGWLILIGAYIAYCILFLLYTILFEQIPALLDQWGLPSFLINRPSWLTGSKGGASVTVRFGINLVTLFGWVITARYFLQRRRRFKRCFIGMMVLSPLLVMLNRTVDFCILLGNCLRSPETPMEILRMAVFIGGWIFYAVGGGLMIIYILKSRRVVWTFTNP